MRRFRTLMAVASVALAVFGCGGEEESGDTAATAAVPAQTLEIRETEFALEPAEVRLDAPGTYTFRAVNDGAVDHALEIEGHGVEDETETIGAGESGEVTVELHQGTYEMYCPVGNHKDQGMVGRVVVGGGGATTTSGVTTTNGETEESEPEDDSNSGSGEGYGY